MIETIDIFFAFQLGVLGYVITCILMTQDYLLEWYLDLLLILETKGKFGKWLSKPLGLCEKCFTGQLALWIWVWFSYVEYIENWSLAMFRHIVFISFSILFVVLMKNIFDRWK